MAGFARRNMRIICQRKIGLMPACFLLAVFICAAPPCPSWAKVYLTLDDALKEVFQSAERVEKKDIYLSVDEAQKAASLAGANVKSRHFVYYTAREKGEVTGYACFMSHVVRTRNAVTMIVFGPDFSVRQVRVAAFYEPEEYLPAPRWFAQFKGKILSDGLRPGQDIQAVSGATLSVNGITREVRLTLAVLETMLKKRE